ARWRRRAPSCAHGQLYLRRRSSRREGRAVGARRRWSVATERFQTRRDAARDRPSCAQGILPAQSVTAASVPAPPGMAHGRHPRPGSQASGAASHQALPRRSAIWMMQMRRLSATLVEGTLRTTHGRLGSRRSRRTLVLRAGAISLLAAAGPAHADPGELGPALRRRHARHVPRRSMASSPDSASTGGGITLTPGLDGRASALVAQPGGRLVARSPTGPALPLRALPRPTAAAQRARHSAQAGQARTADRYSLVPNTRLCWYVGKQGKKP
ncbi:MAG: hypothetical protein JWN65_1045, partial [Solirubrobacterales bacterium]|nr:hypothetical protein [Solirubrobacterales bacterium]